MDIMPFAVDTAIINFILICGFASIHGEILDNCAETREAFWFVGGPSFLWGQPGGLFPPLQIDPKPGGPTIS